MDEYTPKITEMSPLSVSSAGELLTVTGSRLNGLVVTIGGELCVEVSAQAWSVTCTVPNLSAGRHKIKG